MKVERIDGKNDKVKGIGGVGGVGGEVVLKTRVQLVK